MTSDQQRAVDEAIIEGRLIDAVRLYRGATGTALGEAEAYVQRRSAGLGTDSRSSATPIDASPSNRGFGAMPAGASSADTITPLAASISKRVWLIVGAIVSTAVIVPLIIVALVTTLTIQSFHGIDFSHGLAGIATITNEPYYPDVVKTIEGDRGFANALGRPIAVDTGTFCNYVHDDATQHKANCTIPVHGSKSSGSVRVQIVDQAATMDLGAWLTVDGRTIPIGSSN